MEKKSTLQAIFLQCQTTEQRGQAKVTWPGDTLHGNSALCIIRSGIAMLFVKIGKQTVKMFSERECKSRSGLRNLTFPFEEKGQALKLGRQWAQ